MELSPPPAHPITIIAANTVARKVLRSASGSPLSNRWNERGTEPRRREQFLEQHAATDR